MCNLHYPTYVNVMLYGESGLGKTTCIRNLIGSWPVQRCGAAFSAVPGTKTSLEQFRRDPSSLRIELQPIRDNTSNLEMHFSFQVNSLKTVIHFLLKQRQRDYKDNKAGQTEACAVPGTMMRHGITVCLYFVPPHRAKPIDWIMMAAISKLVAVIPVIAKADTFTAQEMEQFRQELLQDMQARRCCKGVERLPPFAIVSSKDLLTADEAGQPGMEGGEVGQPFRRYRWGTAFPLKREHSDLIILKQLLCGHRNFAVHDLLQDSWRRAHAFSGQYESLLRRCGRFDGIGLAPGQQLAGLSLQPLVDEVCCSTCGGTTELQDKLRSEEAKRTITAAAREADSLRGQLQAAAGVVEHLRAELDEARAAKQQKGKLATWLAKDKPQRAR
ncbi:Septin-domain-containing protein [Scenedesmus sp. NREL 46B-D3]|nr:Septin-domain-containing protein [Scenedesmus sp. NREL 46B-D3]